MSDNKVIEKTINFTLLDIEDGLYNLSFGDKDKNTVNSSAIDDKIVSNNGDMNKVLATLFQAVLLFTENKDSYKKSLEAVLLLGRDYTEWLYQTTMMNYLNTLPFMV